MAISHDIHSKRKGSVFCRVNGNGFIHVTIHTPTMILLGFVFIHVISHVFVVTKSNVKMGVLTITLEINNWVEAKLT